MKKMLLLIPVLFIFFDGCADDELYDREIMRARWEKFELLKVDYEYATNKVAAWDNLSRVYGEAIYGAPESERPKINAIFDHYNEEAEVCRKESREIFFSLCEAAVYPSNFDWIYKNQTANLRDEDIDINRNFFRKVIDEIFSNEYFRPDSNWVELRKSVLGREFYTQQ